MLILLLYTLLLTLVSQWIEEVNDLCPGVPVLLVGLKKDLRTNPVAVEEVRKRASYFVAPEEAQQVAKEIGARRYLECSALTGEGVDDIFEVATRASLLVSSTPPHTSCCIIL